MHDLGTITFLDVTSEDGEQLAEYHAGHPLLVTAHVQLHDGVSPDRLLNTHVGLVKKLAPAEDHAQGWTCYLGSLHHPAKPVAVGSSGQVVLSSLLHIPENCIPPGTTSGTFNLWVALNPATELDYPSGAAVPQEDLNTQFFALEGHSTDGEGLNQGCLDRDGRPGCVIDLQITESPGHNVELDRLKVTSNVLVLGLDACHPVDGSPHLAAAEIEAEVGLVIHGSDPDEGVAATSEFANALAPLLEPGEAIRLRASLCPRAENGACVPGADYLPLVMSGSSKDAAGKPTGSVADSVPVTELVVDRDHSLSLDLHVAPESNLCQKLVGTTSGQPTDEWAQFSVFNLRVCAEVPFDEDGHGADESTDNCQVVPLRFVLVDGAGDPAANFIEFDHAWDRSTGNDVVSLSAAAGTINHFNLDGAYSHSYANAHLGGWLSFDFIDINFEGLAYVSILGSGVEAHVDVFGIREWGYEKWVAAGADTVNVSGDFNFAKEYCLAYNYGVAGVGLNASLCATGSAGVEPAATIKAVQAAGAPPFAASTRIGDIQASATPKAQFDLSASAYLDVAIAKGGVTGRLVLLHLDAPTDASLQWGLIDNHGSPALVVVSDVNSVLNSNVLAGDISVWVELYEPSWCYCDHWYCPDWIPCFNWEYVVNEPLVSFPGYGFRTTLIDTGVQQLTLGM